MLTSNFLVNLSVDFDKPTGIGTYLKNIIPHLCSLNPTLLSNKIYSEFKRYSIPRGMTSENGKKGHFKRLFWTQYELPKIYKQISSQLLFSPVPEAPLCQKVSFVTTVHDLIPVRFPGRFSPLSFYYQYYVPQVCRQAQHILTVSQSTADDLVTTYGISSQKITPILLAYDSKYFQPMAVKSTEFYFLYIGRHDSHKNLKRFSVQDKNLKRIEGEGLIGIRR
ncbi:glycosyltransferase family 4 protein (plasmid) [Picosynechococcus sp. PCC 11901]|uniref:glycosyltransferase n=1 Tax=Picosynechococcus sp. PCC 11901 TaxID=2579791 RepID=UPI0010FC3412|nr:glycosyltransferase [Picosynechococcus sp. PCC 11901]QCS51064.1 glycosyltransferase family 4 protein [Picosynechococcus sp. PCC 11901]